MRHDLTVIAYEIHIGTKYVDIYRLCRYRDLFPGAIRGSPALAAGFGSGEGCEPDSDSAPPDARQGDLFGAKPFDRRDGRQIYVSLLVLVVPLLPGEPASVAQPERRGAEFRPFAAPVAGLRHRRDALSGELQPAKHTGTRHPAEYHPDGRHPQALFVAQPPRPVRPQGIEILLFAAYHAFLYPAALCLQQLQVEQEDRPERVRTGQTHLHRSHGGHHGAGRELLFQLAAEQNQAYHRRQELRQYQIPLFHRRRAVETGEHHQRRAAPVAIAHAQRQPGDQRYGTGRPRTAYAVQLLPALQRERRYRPGVRRPYPRHRDRLCDRTGQGPGKFVVQCQQPTADAQCRGGHRQGQGRTGRYGYDKCPVRIVPDRRGVPDGLFEPARPGGHRTPVFHPAFRLGHGQGPCPHGQGEGRHGAQPDRAGRNRLPAHNLYAHRTIPQPAEPMHRGRPGTGGR